MSEPFTVAEALAWTDARLERGDASKILRGVSTDTRRNIAGTLFLAIRGPRHDAHDHLKAALQGGAAALLVSSLAAVPADATVPVLLADDTTRALGRLATGHRSRFAGQVVAVTGSNGKTTTKEMCADILELSGRCLRNRGNLNNEYGLPLSLLEREAEHRAMVVEIGMNHRGEIAPLAAIARPTVGVITNVGTAHIEHLGSSEEIALEKGDLIASLDPDAVAVLNADDPRVLAQAERTRARVLTFGTGEGADVRAEGIIALPEGGFGFDLLYGGERHEVRIPGLGEPTVPNGLAAGAAALAAGATATEVVRGLARHRGVPGRMARKDLGHGRVLIDDTYNANPQSMEAALRSLARWAREARRFAVLGSMGELGVRAPEAHRAIGRLAAELALTGLYLLGEHAEAVAAGAREAGLAPARIRVAESHAELVRILGDELGTGDWVLVKGSRSMRMERVVEALCEEA